MQIDLNEPGAWTLQSTAALIRSASDEDDHVQLRVTKDGIAYISHGIVGNQDTGNLSFRLETWCCGNGYVGAAASEDEDWVKRIYEVVTKNWPDPTFTYIDIY